ncbi:hypothetical protein CSB45_09450 [candidate division KSB3 bacterium]|uniref:Prepilin-type cleavage/methylation domain-containing protein n=1 Tax=candidate division KSB3 bacterium TaxID=2044937 RepID=A0A2G6E481_9BACT|nr:MAG: hypothetical protein CSB45_09450 [candidate division KSB3 bacterium]PIE29451.1 MAG: hypothetical protein CSA57_08625 [candidate division KSB3 bacterium]
MYHKAQKTSRTQRKLFTTDTGFTFIEVLVCVVILAGVILTMFGVYTHVTMAILRSRNRSIAVRAAQMILERVLAGPHDARVYNGLTSETVLASDSPVFTEVLGWKHTLAAFPVRTNAHVTVDELPFCVDVATEEGPLTLCPKLLKITVDIRYQDHGRDATQTLSLIREAGQR